MHLLLRRLLIVCALLWVGMGARGADYPAWTGAGFVLSLTTDTHGRLWAGTEGDGIYSALPGGQWTHWTTRYGLGDMDGRALACDNQGRIWAGHEVEGLSVFNGRAWRAYSVRTGPLSGHVFAIAVSPVDGSVWIASSCGLARYMPSSNQWTYITRAEGLPSDQIDALAFSKTGTLYAATQCDGLAIAQASDNYQQWQTVAGPDRPAPRVSGMGLPSDLLNCVFVAHDDTVYVGTDDGLAWSHNSGATWQYARGADWIDKARQGDTTPLSPDAPAPPKGALSEDYVTALAEDTDGSLYIGHRRTGTEKMPPAVLQNPSPDDVNRTILPNGYVMALLPLPGGRVAVGQNGNGLIIQQLPGAPIEIDTPTAQAITATALPFPADAAPPTTALLARLTQTLRALPPDPAPATGAFLGDDWSTQGDWVGRYGQQFAVLCGMQGGARFNITNAYHVDYTNGPHNMGDGGVYNYVGEANSSDRRALYSPRLGHRQQAEWNDGSFQAKFVPAFDGPDLWVSVQVPSGPHRIGLYFSNVDGHTSRNRYRDYPLFLKGPATSAAEADAAPTLARARVEGFWGGVYKQFLVRGPGRYWVQIRRNGSHVAKLQGVMVDDLTHADSVADAPWLGSVPYGPPSARQVTDVQTAANAPAQALWSALDGAYTQPAGAKYQSEGREFAYRAAVRAGASDALLANWRWRVPVWIPSDRAIFDSIMSEAYLKKPLPTPP